MNLRVNFVMVSFLAIFALSGLAAKPGPGFNLRNKAAGPITVELYNGSGSILGKLAYTYKADLGTGKLNNTAEKEIDISKNTEITITDKNKKSFKYKFTSGKTIYINWDGTKLYPQRGPLLGITGETDEGYELKNNVKAGDIKPVK